MGEDSGAVWEPVQRKKRSLRKSGMGKIKGNLDREMLPLY